MGRTEMKHGEAWFGATLSKAAKWEKGRRKQETAAVAAAFPLTAFYLNTAQRLLARCP